MSEHQPPEEAPHPLKLELLWVWSKLKSIWAKASSEKVAPFWTAAYRLGVLSLLATIALQLGYKGIMVDSLPSVVVGSLPSVRVSSLPSVSVSDLPSVSIDSLPRVSVRDLPEPISVWSR